MKVDDGVKGLFISRHNKVMGKYNKGWASDFQLRFLMRDETVWPPYIHSVPQVNGRVERAPKKYKMMHLADETTVQWVGKMNQYTDGEAVRKANRGFGICALFTRPLWRFVVSFFLKGGFKNGKRGLLKAVQWSIYQQILVSKIIEKQLREKS